MSFFGFGQEFVPDREDEEKKKYEESYELTALGIQAKILKESYKGIDTDSELVEQLDLLNKSIVDSQGVRDSIASLRDKLQAKIALLQALFAILPYHQHGMTQCSKPLTKKVQKEIT